MLRKPNWPQSLARWQAFWTGELLDRPPLLVHLVATEGLDVGYTPSIERLLEGFDPERNAPIVAAAEEGFCRRAEVEDDMPPAYPVGGGVYYTGAVFGAQIAATANVMVAEPMIHDWAEAASIRYSTGNAWVRRTLGLARQLVERWQGRYAVTPGLIEGPSDICASLRGACRLAEDLYAHPAEVRRLAEMGAEAWQRHARSLFDVIPPVDGGTVTQWSVWAPGRAAALQEDFSSLISPRQFRELFAPLDGELAAAVDTLWVHIHAGALHLVDEFLRIEEVRGIQIVHDGPASPPLERVVAAMQRVQRAGRCLIVRKYSPGELEDVLPHLDPHRLCIDTYATSIAGARHALESITRWAERSRAG